MSPQTFLCIISVYLSIGIVGCVIAARMLALKGKPMGRGEVWAFIIVMACLWGAAAVAWIIEGATNWLTDSPTQSSSKGVRE